MAVTVWYWRDSGLHRDVHQNCNTFYVHPASGVLIVMQGQPDLATLEKHRTVTEIVALMGDAAYAQDSWHSVTVGEVTRE